MGLRDLINYIKKEEQDGYSDEAIRTQLARAGYSSKQINYSFFILYLKKRMFYIFITLMLLLLCAIILQISISTNKEVKQKPYIPVVPNASLVEGVLGEQMYILIEHDRNYWYFSQYSRFDHERIQSFKIAANDIYSYHIDQENFDFKFFNVSQNTIHEYSVLSFSNFEIKKTQINHMLITTPSPSITTYEIPVFSDNKLLLIYNFGNPTGVKINEKTIPFEHNGSTNIAGIIAIIPARENCHNKTKCETHSTLIVNTLTGGHKIIPVKSNYVGVSNNFIIIKNEPYYIIEPKNLAKIADVSIIPDHIIDGDYYSTQGNKILKNNDLIYTHISNYSYFPNKKGVIVVHETVEII